jgi:hypothetical protein
VSRSPAPAAEFVGPPAPEIRQTDGSLMLERKPNPKAKPAHKIPVGMKPERVARVTVKPDQPECDPVTLDLTLVREHEGTRRLITSAPDGYITGGVDVPILAADPVRRWAVGVGRHLSSHSGFGVAVDRDFWRLRASLTVTQAEDEAPQAWLWIKVPF